MNVFKSATWKLSVKISILVSIGIILIFSIFSYFIIRFEKQKIQDETDITMRQEIKSLNTFINITEKNIQSEINSALNTAYYLFSTSGHFQQTKQMVSYEAENQITKEKSKLKVQQWLLGGKQVQYNYEVVDKIKSLSGQTATIFQRIPAGFLRISTNVMKKNGNRAVGTFIPNNSPVIQTILKGQIFRGRAWVVNAWYNTAYMPIYLGKKIAGILYVGIKQRDMQLFKQYFNQRKYYTTGYPSIIDTAGLLMIHPTSQGVNIKKLNIFKEMSHFIGDTVRVHRIEYPWPEKGASKDKVMYLLYNHYLSALVVVTYYKDEIYETLRKVTRFILIFTLISIIIAIILSTFIVNLFTKKIVQAKDFTMAISNGNLQNTLTFKSEDELSLLANSLNKMSLALNKFMLASKQQINHLNEISEELIDSGEQLAEGSQEQAAELEEFTSNLEHINERISQNNSETQITVKEAEKSAEKIKLVSKSIEEANQAMQNIYAKIKIVTDIAEKTDILAINASIEASRAGESGKSFAVIAKEVRELAEKSQKAAIEIMTAVTQGLEIEQKAKQEQEKALPAVENVVQLMLHITKRTEEINNTTSQISGSIGELSSVAQKSANQSEKLKKTAEKLSMQAEELAQHINFWTLKE